MCIIRMNTNCPAYVTIKVFINRKSIISEGSNILHSPPGNGKYTRVDSVLPLSSCDNKHTPVKFYFVLGELCKSVDRENLFLYVYSVSQTSQNLKTKKRQKIYILYVASDDKKKLLFGKWEIFTCSQKMNFGGNSISKKQKQK